MIDFYMTDDSETRRAVVIGWQSAAWPHLSDGIEVEVYSVHKGWYVRSSYDCRSARGQWNRGLLCETREEAADEARDLLAECVRLMRALHRGETLRTPSDVMHEAWEATEEARRLRGDYETALEARSQSATSDEQWRAAAVRVGIAREALGGAAEVWRKRQDWRDYRDGVEAPAPKPRSGQLSLLEVAA